MKLSNEAKVGLLAIIAIVVLVLGFNFLKGASIFSKDPVLYAEFENVGGLEKSNLVKINGLDVGKVYTFKPKDKEINRIVVEIHLTREVAIPKNSIAFIDQALLGGAFINITKGTANNYLESGDTISTRLDLGFVGDLKTQIAPTVTKINETLDSLKIAIGNISTIFDPNTKNNMRTLIANMTVSSMHLQELLNAQTGQLAQAMGHINTVTANLAKNNDAITSSIRNIEVTTSKLANANIEQVIAALQGTVSELEGTIKNLNSKNGSIGLLMNDRELYDRLNKVADRMHSTALSAEILLDDLRLHPKRYVNISLIGRKTSSQPITSPAIKDTIPK
jgi:phospholipid/cholesterol/gamma-HCH transport system substrate-binding protein